MAHQWTSEPLRVLFRGGGGYYNNLKDSYKPFSHKVGDNFDVHSQKSVPGLIIRFSPGSYKLQWAFQA